MGMPIIDAFNPAPTGPVRGARRSIVSVHRRRRKNEVRRLIRDVRRKTLVDSETPQPTENALLLTYTRDQLRAEAKSRGLTNYGSLNKQGLRDLLGVTA